eukprot:SAG11_NODE_753_length_7341_cov_4.014637_1_plen_75_part_10
MQRATSSRYPSESRAPTNTWLNDPGATKIRTPGGGGGGGKDRIRDKREIGLCIFGGRVEFLRKSFRPSARGASKR